MNSSSHLKPIACVIHASNGCVICQASKLDHFALDHDIAREPTWWFAEIDTVIWRERYASISALLARWVAVNLRERITVGWRLKERFNFYPSYVIKRERERGGRRGGEKFVHCPTGVSRSFRSKGTIWAEESIRRCYRPSLTNRHGCASLWLNLSQSRCKRVVVAAALPIDVPEPGAIDL